MKTLDELSGMPQMGAAFTGWMKTISVVMIIQTNDDGLITDVEVPTTFEGVIQPLSPEKINLKPEGQRSFQWLQVHCFSSDLNLATNDRIIYNAKKYKVMAIEDYSLNGYIEYHIIEDYA